MPSSQNTYMVGIRSVADYSPFGVELDGRTETGGGYRYKFNGMEADDEIKGSGNSYTTEFRQYDSRVGRWLTVDPLTQSFPFQSPYIAFDNSPILLVDPKGLAASKKDKEIKEPTDKQIDKIEKRINKIKEKAQRISLREKKQAEKYIDRHGGTLQSYDSYGSTRYGVRKESENLGVSIKTFNRKSWAGLGKQTAKATFKFGGLISPMSQSFKSYGGPIDVIGFTGGYSYTTITLADGMKVYSKYTSVLFITRGADFGLWKSETVGGKYGIQWEYSIGLVVGKYWGQTRELRASTLEGSGNEAAIDFIGGLTTWSTIKPNGWPGWTGFVIGAGPAFGLSAGETDTNIQRY